jgi:shikimate dehydrogenase
MDTFGLIGKKLGHSFSKAFFERKFKELGINSQYLNFELDDIRHLKNMLNDHPRLKGLNVTIPYKKDVMNYIDSIDPIAAKVGSVNTLKIIRTDDKISIRGYNTDVIGFEETLKPLVAGRKDISALILGTGGASNAVAFVLQKLHIPYTYVSRVPKNKEQFSYKDLTEKILHKYQLIINTTPVGMFPVVSEVPPIPYQYLNAKHILYDLIYNPEETKFLKFGREKSCQTINGLKMLELQAEASWRIWNS